MPRWPRSTPRALAAEIAGSGGGTLALPRGFAHTRGVPAWFTELLPDRLHTWLSPLLSPPVLAGLTAFSVLTFVASVVGVPYFLSRLPSDYFSREERQALGIPEGPRAPIRVVLRVLRNLLGLLLVVLGILMLVLPGQAILTILIGVFMMDFPGKRRFERWVIARPRVMRMLNSLRRRAGKPPIEPRTSWFPPSARSSTESAFKK